MSPYQLYVEASTTFAEEMPDLWRLCFPRHYVPPNGYAHAKISAVSAAGQMLTSVSVPRGEFNKTMVDCIVVTWKALEMGMPTFFVGHDIIADLAQSEPPYDMKLEELKWPYDALIFHLPESFQRQYFKRTVPIIFIARQPTGLIIAPECVAKILPHSPPCGIEQAGRSAFAFCAPVFFLGKPVDYAGSWPMDTRVGDLIKNPAFYDNTRAERDDYLPAGIAPTPEEDIELTNKIFMVGLWLLMLLNAEPRHLELGAVTCKRSSAHAAKSKDDLWAPNFIGRTYHATEWQGGTHASPRAHKRRGHWTHQRHGPKNSLTKLLWIRRIMIGVKV